ncbi:uncharacterized protein EAE98_011404 [Botrytis deweyae]|uniref:F-box domain-containing protein n=1 Tax=Botrytis deweyae TaxID=2478750 RepID=A0ABQ7I5Q6_9HELO|nr:uncharacterized protein EAE98_011404 [Botrytis deweyae]KAF7914705.1 hypothetical protein EAE98_011404 [Botrytis deweyae]
MAFLSFPLEVLQNIAVFLEIAHRPSLDAFTLTNKACHAAAIFLVFRQIVITVDDRKELRRDVDGLIETLSRTDSFRHIRRITIKGALRPSTKKTEGFGPQTCWLAQTGLDEVLVDEEAVQYGGLYTVYDGGVIEKFSEEDMAWAPVVNLLQAKIHLEDLVYDCQSQFPPSLLRTLHEQHPQCRLHHLTFRFRTLLWGIPYSYEMELATSPSLYRVKITCALRDSEYDDDFNLEAMMELTSGLAPNLKEVVVLNLLPGRSLKPVRPRGSWQGLPGFTGEKVGSLTSLSLKGYSRLDSPKMLQNWARYTDFAFLRHLTLGGCYDAKMSGLSGETMEWVAQNHFFPRVKTLNVYLTRKNYFHGDPNYSEHAVSFFRAFESLEELSIDGSMDSPILDTVLSHHGQTLKKLSFNPFENFFRNAAGHNPLDLPLEFTHNRILQIEAQCPILEELAVPVKRNKSSVSEAKMYRCFGRMKRLRSLFLILDCSNWRVTRDSTYNPEFDEEDQKPIDNKPHTFLKRGELKETFINCAVDEALARSIWETINQNKSGRRLERLKLWPTGAGEYGVSDRMGSTFNAMADSLIRSWLFERVPRDDDEESFTVRELGRHGRKELDQMNQSYLSYFHDPEIWEVLRSIWPAKEGSRDWLDDCSSFPLQVENFSH